MIDPLTGMPVPGTDDLIRTMVAPSPVAGGAMPMPASAAFGHMPHDPRMQPMHQKPMGGAGGDARFMQMLARLQGSPIWDQIMASPQAQAAGMTPEAMAGITSRNQFAQQFPGAMGMAMAARPQMGFGMPAQAPQMPPQAPVAPGLPTEQQPPQQQQGWQAGDVFGGGPGGGMAGGGLGRRARGPGFGL